MWRCITAPLFFVFLFYVQATCLLSLVLLLLGAGISHAAICEHYLWLLGTRFATAPHSRPVLDDTTRPVIFLCNHRSWGDFWVDSALLGGTSFISRWAVAFAIPFSALWGWLHGWIWFFKRGAKRAEGTTKWMEVFMRRCHMGFAGKGVVLYPEGTRTLLPQGLPLKPGGLAVAYALGWPAQVVITSNKERVMAERSFSLGLFTSCVTSASAPLWPQDYQSTDAFIAAVGAAWRATWEEAYGPASVPRASATLPGVARRRLALALPGTAGLNRARLVVAATTAMVWWRCYAQANSGPDTIALSFT